MDHRRFSLPHATKLTLVAALKDGFSATGVALSPKHALTLARAEMQERRVAANVQLNAGITGFGTGRSQVTADKRAEAEAIERYAVDRWWFHGQRPLPCDPLDKGHLRRILCSIGRESPRIVQAGALAHINNLSVYFAVSCDQSRHGLCFGFGTTLRRAVIELMQMEFAYNLLTYKVGEDVSITRDEQRQWDRAQNLCLDQIALPLAPGPSRCNDVALCIRPLDNANGALKISCAQIAATQPFTVTDSTPWRRWSPM